ncbi:MAG: hypothetical protein O9302_13625 [Cyclobacteriaceae bacterium]|jgi:hypothetical protein|nr:hypothetical protein [Cytophagales bacterium]MCZ8329100.1 hypothetical protein [Cyclobacteriaceae bacterium]
MKITLFIIFGIILGFLFTHLIITKLKLISGNGGPGGVLVGLISYSILGCILGLLFSMASYLLLKDAKVVIEKLTKFIPIIILVLCYIISGFYLTNFLAERIISFTLSLTIIILSYYSIKDFYLAKSLLKYLLFILLFLHSIELYFAVSILISENFRILATSTKLRMFFSLIYVFLLLYVLLMNTRNNLLKS